MSGAKNEARIEPKSGRAVLSGALNGVAENDAVEGKLQSRDRAGSDTHSPLTPNISLIS